ncbi:MAG: MlaD family protein [Candidatus Latescibacteria bacterium]|nr:MlaD family protein [Candidatus Latescibacterota bacterium]
MTPRGLEIRVGAVVIAAAIVAVVGTMWFQKFQLAEKRYAFFVRFNEVGGLVSGDPIHVNGVERGRVDAVDLLPRGVVVRMAVREGVVIPLDSRIALKSIGIMGERFVAIVQGDSSVAIAPGDTLDGDYLMGLSEVMGSAGEILDEVETTSRHLRDIAISLSGDGRLQEGVDDFAVASKNVRTMTERNRDRLDRALIKFEHSATLLDSLIATRYAGIDSSLAAIGRAGGKAEETADNLAVVSKDLREITAKLRAGEGSAGRLLNDDTFITRLESTVTQLDSLVADIQRNPSRYVKFSLF